MKIKVVVPFPMEAEALRNRAAQVDAIDLAPETTVDFVAVKNSARTADSPYDTFLMEMFVFEAGLGAEQEGYDALCIDTISDSAISPLRSRLAIPVIGPGEVAWHVATILARRFSIITLSEKWVPAYTGFLTKSGLWDRVASVRSIDKSPDLENLLEGDVRTFEAIEHESRRAIAEDGAAAIVLGSTTMHEAYTYLAERLPCPVINPGLWGIKFAEICAQADIAQSKIAYPAPPIPVDNVVFERLAPARAPS